MSSGVSVMLWLICFVLLWAGYGVFGVAAEEFGVRRCVSVAVSARPLV